MRARKKRKHIKIKICIAVFLFIAVSVFIVFDKLIDKKLKAIAEIKCQSYAENAISTAAEESISHFSSDDFVKKLSDGEKVTSIEVNSVNVNKFKSQLANAVSDELSIKKNQEYKVSVGSVLGSNLLYNLGPKINMHFQKEGSVNVYITSDFSGSGINQTVHRVYASVSVTFLAVTPAGNFQVPYETNLIICETVIVGDTPSIYAGLGKEQKNT